MDNFVSESSIGGVSVFHSSESKKTRILWLFIYFLFYILIGFYIAYIYSRCRLEPEFSYTFSEFSLQDIPYPAVTICSPLFARDQKVNLQEFLKNPTQNLTIEQQNLLAANVQACAPKLGSKIHQFCPLADAQNTVEALKSKFLRVDDAFEKVSNDYGCAFSWKYTYCSKILNYVLTDFGYCFTFNLQGFQTIFNTETISDDFKSYSRNGKIVKSYYFMMEDHQNLIDEANQTIVWSLERGFMTNSRKTLPVRINFKENFSFYGKINATDVTNLCPTMGKSFLMFFHMTNEILTPFHKPMFLFKNYHYFLNAKIYKVDESLRPYSPQKRNCYFEGERKLKFFKSYTKAHCEFECLANFTLAQCDCVKFSMPRENSTRICGLNETSCYIQVSKNWNLTCDCLHSCTYIEYGIQQEMMYEIRKSKFSNFFLDSTINFENIFGDKVEVTAVYNIYQGFADFGGMLGTLFGASLISLIEIFYFMFLSSIKKKFKMQEKIQEAQSANVVSSSTIHGVQFIFDNSRHKLIRIFWIFAFIFAFSCCMYNSRDSYWKLNVVPDTETATNLKPIEEIPFPAITICSPMLSRENYTDEKFISKFNRDIRIISKLTSSRYYYMIANYYWHTPNVLYAFIKSRNEFYENNTVNPESHRFEVNLFPYLFESHLDVDELIFDCKLQEKSRSCNQLFRKIMTVRGICYAFNHQSHSEIFNEKISKNFDSFGKFEVYQDPQWSLDQGYFLNTMNPQTVKASYQNILEFKVNFSSNSNNGALKQKYYINLPNDLISYVSKVNYLRFNVNKIVKLTAKSRRMDESLQKFTPQNRGCYFQNERLLQFFKSYTRSNCMLECLTNYTFENCDCVSYLLPHNDSMSICGSANEVKCYYNNLELFPPSNDNLNPCGCLPTCNDIEYSWTDEENSLKQKSKEYFVMNLNFKFTGGTMIASEEIHVAFGLQDFLTNVGGLLGLYLGCSFISIFEVFYILCTFFHAKWKKRKQIASNNTEVEIMNKEEQKEYENHENIGQTLAEIFDLHNLTFEKTSAVFGPKVHHSPPN